MALPGREDKYEQLNCRIIRMCLKYICSTGRLSEILSNGISKIIGNQWFHVHDYTLYIVIIYWQCCGVELYGTDGHGVLW